MAQKSKKFWIALVAGVGCLVPIAGCCVFFGVVGTTVGVSLKSAEPYQEGLARARGNAQVIEALGEPINEGWMPSGSIGVNGAGGHADVSVGLSGPKGSGTLYVSAIKQAGAWKYNEVVVELDNGTRIPL